MSDRSTEARQLARWLSQDTETEFQIEWAGGRSWQVMWADGPVVTEVRESIAFMMDVHERFLTLRDRELHLMRGYTLRAWAAVAVAARRDGSLAQALADAGPTDRPAHHTLSTFVEHKLDRAIYPDQEIPRQDEPLVEELITSTEQSRIPKVAMAQILASELIAPEPGGGPCLRLVPRSEGM